MTKREGTYDKQSKASSRRVTLLREGWTEVSTKKLDGRYEVWGIPPKDPPAGIKIEIPGTPAGATAEPPLAPPTPGGADAPAPAAPSPTPGGKARPVKPKRTPPKAAGPRKSRKGIKLANPGPRSRPKGIKTGLGVEACWVHLFEKNETLPDGKKLSDKQITEFLNAEFPGRNSLVFKAVANVRAKYNRGGLTKGKVPKPQSQCYGD